MRDVMLLGSGFPIDHSAQANLVGVGSIGTNEECQCGGLGVIVSTRVLSGPTGHQPQTGKGRVAIYGKDGWYIAESETIPCPMCLGDKGEIVQHLLQNCNVPAENRSKSLSYYDGKSGAEDMAVALRRVVRDLPNCKGFITIFGNHSTGKTVAAQSVVVSACRELVNARYITARELVANAKETWGDAEKSEKDYMDSLSIPKLLVIDEVDSVYGKDTRYIETVVDNRYQMIDSTLTIMIVNGPLNVNEYLDARMKAGVRIPVT